MNDRYNYIDVARGIGILLVVIGHTITRDLAQSSILWRVVRLFIYTIHMPIFFVISGMLFELNIKRYICKGIGKYVSDKFKSYMIPYFSFSLITYVLVAICSRYDVLSAILSKQGYKNYSLGESIMQIITYQGHQDGHLWFCYVMFLILIINIIFIKKNTWKLFIALLGIEIIFALWFNEAPQLIRRVGHYLYLFSFGRQLVCMKIQKKTGFGLCCLGLVAFAGLAWTTITNQHVFIALITPIVELSSGLCIVQYIAPNAMHMNGFSKKVLNVIKYMGKSSNSYAIYLIHMPFIVSSIVFFLTKLPIPNIITITLSSTGGIILSLTVYHWVKKSQIANIVLFGKK